MKKTKYINVTIARLMGDGHYQPENKYIMIDKIVSVTDYRVETLTDIIKCDETAQEILTMIDYNTN